MRFTGYSFGSVRVDGVVLPTAEAIGVLAQTTKDTNAILHLTC
jgi:hypothetical protein